MNKIKLAIIIIISAFIISCIIIPDILTRHTYTKQNYTDALSPPDPAYILGTDHLGRDIYSRIIYGTKYVITVGLGSVIIAMILGVPLGLISGYYGGILDSINMRIQDAILCFPVILLALLIIATLGASQINVIITISFVYIPRFARLVRGCVMDIKNNEYVLNTKICGASDFRIMFSCILPNIIPPIIVQASLALAIAILIEAGLSYLGLGIQPPIPSWGNMLQQSQNYIYSAPWFVFSPGFAIFSSVLFFNFLGDWVRDFLDPQFD